jgi:hypothetical protein
VYLYHVLFVTINIYGIDCKKKSKNGNARFWSHIVYLDDN